MSACANEKNMVKPPVVDTTGMGRQIGRTMWLLGSGTPEKHTRLKVVFYGQSIIDENNQWTKNLLEHLKAQYPYTDFEPMYHLAVGGYSTQVMAPMTHMDMKWHYPDLVIVLITGSHYDFDTLVREIKETTTADVMILTNHITRGNKLNYASWEDTMANEHLPAIAKKYGAELCPVRKTWRDYLIENDVDENVFLGEDGGHLNTNGQHFMLSMVRQFFVRDEAAAVAAGNVLADEWMEVRADSWKDGVLTVPFHGNRVEVVGERPRAPLVEIRVDGKKPSEVVELYAHSRIGHGWHSSGLLRRLEVKAPHTPQTWVIEFTRWEEVPVENKEGEEKQEFVFAYTVTGEKDGLLGTSTEGTYRRGGKWSWENKVEGGDFDSRIFKISGESFAFGFKRPALHTRYIFETKLNGTDRYDGSTPLLFSGLPVGDHVLTLTAKDKGNIQNIKRIRFSDPMPPSYPQIANQ